MIFLAAVANSLVRKRVTPTSLYHLVFYQCLRITRLSGAEHSRSTLLTKARDMF